MNSEIYAVVVTYNPDITYFSEVIMGLFGQVDRIVIIDNDSKNILEIEGVVEGTQVELIKFSENNGIASAQNKGITYAESCGAQYILLMDQDTVLPEGAVSALHKECTALEIQGIKVGAIGFAYRDTHDGKLNAIWKANGRKLEKQTVKLDEAGIVEVDFVIASGSLVPLSTLREIGLMEEELFIDLVDIEWGLRAKSHGYQSYQSFTHIMTHTLGEGRLNVLGKIISLHSPIRNYYTIRNSILMVRRHYVGWAWRRYFLKRIIPYLVVFSFLPSQKWLRSKFMMCAIVDGLLGRSGSFHSRTSYSKKPTTA